MNSLIPALQKGDKIYICAPAKAIEPEHIFFAEKKIREAGFEVEISKHCLGTHNYFSGTLEERLADFQHALDSPDIKTIICARGGYGCVQLSDRLQWAAFLRNPKWIVGFSDVTFFHQKIQKFGLQSLHATMPLNYQTNSPESFETLWKAMRNEKYEIQFAGTKYNKPGEAKGILVGGNLSILSALIGTDDEPDYRDTILYFEDLCEYLYHIDRIMYSFAKRGIFNKIKGLIVGGMTDLKDTPAPFGMNYQEIILSHFQFINVPIAFDFPAGHIEDNRALVLGTEVEFSVNNNCFLRFK